MLEDNLEKLNFELEEIIPQNFDNLEDFIAAKIDQIPSLIVGLLPDFYANSYGLFALQLKWISEYYTGKKSIKN